MIRPKRRKIHHVLFVLSVVCCCLFLRQILIAEERTSPITCGGCHKAGTSILPASHKSYSMENATLCFGCHKAGGKGKPLGEKIHLAHANKSPETMKECFSCHVAGADAMISLPGRDTEISKERMEKLQAFFLSWMTSSYLDDQHRRQGLACHSCHSDPVNESKASEVQTGCVKCHGDTVEMAGKTAALSYANNPHNSPPHSGGECSACHHGHKAFEDACGMCHKFGYKAPAGKRGKAGHGISGEASKKLN